MKKKSILRSEISDSEIRYRRLFESSKDGILILDAETGKIEDVNPFLIDLLGYSKNEFVEKSLWEIGAFQDIFENKEKFNELQLKEYVRYSDLPLVTSDGHKIHVEFVSNVYLVKNNKVIQCSIRDITEQKAKEDSLEKTHRATSDFLNILLNHMHAPIIIWDTTMIIIRFNSQFELLSGYDSADVIGKKIDFLFPKEKIAATLELLKNQLDDDLEITEIDILTKDNNIRTVLWNSSHIHDEEGKNIIATISQDITSRKRTEDALSVSEARYRRLFESAKAGILILDAETGKIVDVNPFLIDLLGYSKNEFIEKSIWEVGSFRDIYETREKFLDLQQEDYVRYDDLPLVTSDGRKIHVEFVSNVYLVNNTKIIQCNVRDTTEHKQAQDLLQESEERFRSFFENSMDGILLTKPEGKIISANPAACKKFGYTEQELIQSGRSGIVDTSTPQLSLLLAERAANGKARGELTYIHKDGTPIPCEISSAIFKNRKGIEFTSMIIRDISERKQIQQKIKDSEKRFRAIFDQAPIAIALIDLQGHPIASNLRLSEMLGYSKEELSKMMFTEFTYPDDTDKDLNQFTDLIAGKISGYNMEKRYIHKNGNVIWANLYVTTLNDNNGLPQEIIGMVEDITERKIAERELIRKDQDLKKAQQIAHLGSWYMDIATNNVTWTEELYKMYGFDPTQPVPPYTEHMKLFTPESWEILSTSFAKTRETGIPYELELKTIKKDGTNGWMWVRGEAEKDRNEIITGLWGAAQDISKRKNAEEELQNVKNIAEESEILYRTVVSNSPMVSFVLNSKGIFTLSEGKGLDKLGLKPGEVVGLSALKLYKDYPVIIRDIEKTLAGSVSRSEISLPGVVFDITYNPIFDNEGNLKEIIGIANDITERKQAEIEVEKQKLELEEYFENDISANYLASAEGEIFSCNRTFIEMFGFEEKIQAYKFNIIKLYRNPDDRMKLVASVKKTGKIENFELDFVARDGKIIHAVINAIGIFDDKHELNKIRCYVVDITKQKNVEKELLKLSRAVEQSPSSVIVADLKGNIEYVNPKTLEITGYTKEELIGKNPRIFSSGDKPKGEYQQLWNTISSANEWVGEFHNKKKTGELYWESASISPILNQKQEIINYVAIKEDITERKKFIGDLKIAKEKAEESDRLKSAFLANMSHEIRTPMNGILGFTELLLEPNLDSEQKEEYIGFVKQSGQRMLNTVNDIVEISKIEAGIVTVKLKEVDIQVSLDELIQFFTPEVTKKGLKLTLENEVPKINAVSSTDKNKLSSILTYLIKNAIKYTPAGEIRVGCTVGENMLEFYVKDTGIGISPERQHAIFDRFVQADIEDTRAFEGSGLGLAIAKAYVEMLGGKIWVKSEPGTGSTFYFNLPWEVSKRKTTVTESVKTEISQSGSKLKVLIAEDDTVSFQHLSILLRKYTREILHATNGEQVVEICKEQPDIDLILMDIKMPLLDGFDATRRIREFNKEVPIIAQTAYALSGDSEKALEAGCNDYIPKPINKKVLMNKIGKLKLKNFTE